MVDWSRVWLYRLKRQSGRMSTKKGVIGILTGGGASKKTGRPRSPRLTHSNVSPSDLSLRFPSAHSSALADTEGTKCSMVDPAIGVHAVVRFPTCDSRSRRSSRYTVNRAMIITSPCQASLNCHDEIIVIGKVAVSGGCVPSGGRICRRILAVVIERVSIIPVAVRITVAIAVVAWVAITPADTNGDGRAAAIIVWIVAAVIIGATAVVITTAVNRPSHDGS